MESPNPAEKNIDKLAALFPNCITESAAENGRPKKAVNFDMLRAMLSEDIAAGDEAYEFTWVGKKAAIAEANRPIRKTLRPCPEESADWNSTENLYIEGDNLEVLKLLQESYLGRVKMIYIDPPYNTKNDYIYRDNFTQTKEEYEKQLRLFNEDGSRLFKNTENNGRFHSDWCSMMYSRLMLARNLLSDDGVIFISIDDNEYDNLKKICDEIYGTSNLIANIVWKRKRGRDNSAKWFSKAHEYLLLYANNKNRFNINYLELDEETKKAYKNPDNDPRGKYRMLGCWARGTQGGVKYDFTTKDGHYFSERLWLYGKEALRKLDEENKLIIHGDNIYRKMFLSENKGKIPETLWDNVSNAANAADEIKKIFGDIVFDTPKPLPFITEMIKIAATEDSLILDFFSGSASTAHAVMRLNAEDGGHRRFIMVQLPETTDEDSEAYKSGYKNICEIGKDRIRRAGNIIKETCPPSAQTPDIGFRVFRVDDSNMRDVYYSPAETDQQMLLDFESNIKPDRTDLDLLFGCLLEWGLPLSMPYKSEKIDGVTVHNYNDGDLIACFDKAIPENVIKTIANRRPLRAVFRDDSFSDSLSKINVSGIFRTISPETKIKVI